MELAMNAVVVGADRLGNLPDVLKAHNIKINKHITGRDPAHQKKNLSLPSGTQLLILLTDFLGHNVMKSFRSAAEKQNIPIVACKRSVCSMQQALEQCPHVCAQCPNRKR
ncbi:DUF2325 domain-containing protein [Pelistega europaea]|uniref:DUF2325 domain-containing protein n=1 Tax=Pelistega europaea TaxID=106147 RepID=A0A7Y4P468_9BURK|nr:DUF2325 domain-containing protein [Pelistega europaea]NOL49186.1 DUF2325 domain-containing protein [Pelistega europaea]